MSDKETTSKTLTRRNFLKKTGGAAAMAGMALGGMTLQPRDAAAAWDAMPKKWDETYDVVVIGSGFAGLAAAYEAKKAGASVVVLEKMRTVGGNSIINGGIIAAAGSPLQEKLGLKDSDRQMEEDMIREGLGLNHPDLVRLVAEQSVDTVNWTINELGAKYNMDKLVQEGGHAVPRSYATYNSSGSAIVLPLLEKLKAIGVVPKTQAYLSKILRDKDGRVKGVEIRDGYVFPKTDSGKIKTIKARKGVVLAYGGFGQDVAFRMIQDPKLTAKFESTNQPGATAECWREAFRIGCTPVQLDWIQVGPWASPDEKGFGLGPHFAQEAAAMFGIWINTTTGKRFISELANRKLRADIIMQLGNKGQNCIAIADADGVSELTKGIVPKLLERNVVKQFKTIEELAAAYKVPIEPFMQTVANYNKFVIQGKDDEFGRYMNKKAKPIATSPFYGMRLLPKIHHCMGGVNINTQAQALDVATDKPIPGLYAAGEAVGGVHGAVRLGSCATLDCLVFGRIAGQLVVKDQAWG
jgi:flavocytochrome c